VTELLSRANKLLLQRFDEYVRSCAILQALSRNHLKMRRIQQRDLEIARHWRVTLRWGLFLDICYLITLTGPILL
jgi:hypothetical protein